MAELGAGTRYHVDHDAGDDDATGVAPEQAWRTLDRVNATVFQPGDRLLLRGGCRWHGTLRPRGSGTADNPIVIDSYGGPQRPQIVGGSELAAVVLHNVQGWEIRRLDVSHPAERDGEPRVGIFVLVADYGVGRHYVVDDVVVHDVSSGDCLRPELPNGGGIVFKAAGRTVPTGFDGIRVTHCTVSGVDNIGIGTLSQWSRRDLYPGGTNTFVPMTRVHIAGNRLSDLGGDGILVQNGVDSMMENNVIDGFALRTTESHAAILAFNSDRAVAQRNEITGGAAMPPSFAFSVDGGNADLVYQHNYSHDNNGPFMLLCAPEGAHVDGVTVRYNISRDDRTAMLGTVEVPLVAAGCVNAVKNVAFYHNVIYSTVASALVGCYPHTSIAFTNNIFVGRAGGSTIVDGTGVYDHNLYHNVVAAPPGDANAVLADPLFVDPGAGPAGFMLRSGSPALRAGAPTPGEEPGEEPPNIGSY